MEATSATPSDANGAPPDSTNPPVTGPRFSEIVDMLLREGYVSDEQVLYAQRVQNKLETPRRLLDVLQELDYVSGDQVKQAIQENHLTMRIGSLLVELGYITEQSLQNAFEIQKEDKKRPKLGEVLVAHNFISQKQFLEVLSIQLGYPLVAPEFLSIDQHLFTRVPGRWYDQHQMIPIRKEGDQVLVAFADPPERSNSIRPPWCRRFSVISTSHITLIRLVREGMISLGRSL